MLQCSALFQRPAAAGAISYAALAPGRRRRGNNAIMAVNRASVLTRRQILGIVAAGVATKWPDGPISICGRIDSGARRTCIKQRHHVQLSDRLGLFFTISSYLQLYQGNVKIVTPENDLKAWRLRSAPASYNFSGADRILAFASTNKIAVHGHTLIWGNGKYNPPWYPRPPARQGGWFHRRICRHRDEALYAAGSHLGTSSTSRSASESERAGLPAGTVLCRTRVRAMWLEAFARPERRTQTLFWS